MGDAASTPPSSLARDPDGRLALWVCNRCGHVYDPDSGEPLQGIGPGVAFEHLPGDWLCPHCGAPKELFIR
jgi:rubredoxin